MFSRVTILDAIYTKLPPPLLGRSSSAPPPSPQFGLHLAAGSANGTVSILTHLSDDSWEAASFLDSPLGTNAVRWAPYKGVSIMELVTGGCDNKVRVWMNGDGNWRYEGIRY